MILKNNTKKIIILAIVFSLITNFGFSINQARALIPVIDPANLATNGITSVMTTAEKILYFLKEFIIYPLVRKIANALENKMVNAVNQKLSVIDGSLPSFVTNWRNHLLNSQSKGNGVFLSVLADTTLCPYFSDQLKNLFGANLCAGTLAGSQVGGAGGIAYQNLTYVPGLPRFQTTAGCTLPAGFNVPAYQQDFRNGGWNAFDALLQPENNYYGAYNLALAEQQTQMFIDTRGNENEALSGSGFLSQKLNLNGSAGPTGCTGNGLINCLFLGKNVTPAHILGTSAVNEIDAKLRRVGFGTQLTDIILALVGGVQNILINRLENYIGQRSYNQVVTGAPAYNTTNAAAPNPYANGPQQICIDDCMRIAATNCTNQATSLICTVTIPPPPPLPATPPPDPPPDCVQRVDPGIYNTCITGQQATCNTQCGAIPL